MFCQQIIKFIITFGYLGKIKYMPGTFGSLAAFPLIYIIAHLTLLHPINFSLPNFTLGGVRMLGLFTTEMLACIILFVIGVYCSSKYIAKVKKEDPSEIVIDEVVGQMLTVILTFASVAFAYNSRIPEYFSAGAIDIIFMFLLPFSLFRAFDIFKPWPINLLDKNVKGGFGVMIDDILAAIFASVIHYVIVFSLISFTN